MAPFHWFNVAYIIYILKFWLFSKQKKSISILPKMIANSGGPLSTLILIKEPTWRIWSILLTIAAPQFFPSECEVNKTELSKFFVKHTLWDFSIQSKGMIREIRTVVSGVGKTRKKRCKMLTKSRDWCHHKSCKKCSNIQPILSLGIQSPSENGNGT